MALAAFVFIITMTTVVARHSTPTPVSDASPA
jgi:hypothetical protein